MSFSSVWVIFRSHNLHKTSDEPHLMLNVVCTGTCVLPTTSGMFLVKRYQAQVVTYTR